MFFCCDLARIGDMLRIERIFIDGTDEELLTDNPTPTIAFTLASDREETVLRRARVQVGAWQTETVEQGNIVYQGEKLSPFSRYEVTLEAEDNHGERAKKSVSFRTGRMGTPWRASWITDGDYRFTAKKTSPVPITFRKVFRFDKEVRSCVLYATALGIYDLFLDGKKVGDRYFAPGFTSYSSQLQYQTYDVSKQIKRGSELRAVVAGGWAVGAFVFTRKNRITANRQALLLEGRVIFADGSEETFGTDESWQVSREGALRFAEFYDGEIYDARREITEWRLAQKERVKIQPKLLADYGAPVRAHERFSPIHCRRIGEELIYDFGQNFAGVVHLTLNGAEGQRITVRHAEVLQKDGRLNTSFLRSAKCELIYICREGAQEYTPSMTYMGFRYVSVQGIAEERLKIEGVALYSDLQLNGAFSCSDERLNRLQENIVWSGKSNFVDIPTDCPQRDERMGWTGDIALFAPTACYNFRMTRFFEKWLKDLAAEQGKGGGIPNTVPKQGYGFPATMPQKAVAFWGDACIYVPYAEYMARGDKQILRRYYPVMKRYLNACLFWAGLFHFGEKKYLWSDPSFLQFGDWVAPDVEKMSAWQKRSKYTATAALARAGQLLAEIAEALGKGEDVSFFTSVASGASNAYCKYLTDGKGTLVGEEFQTGYVLPLYFHMFEGEERTAAVENLVRLLQKNDYRIGTGFPGTPYLLFALADNGREEEAFFTLFNEKCPSWLYEVKLGATTVWERWDGLNEAGECSVGEDGTGGMVSFNHYAFGAVGDFLYRRIAGIQPTSAGYQTFRVQPLVGGGITWVKASVGCAYGEIKVEWTRKGSSLTAKISVPVGARCHAVVGNQERIMGSGDYLVEGEIT